MIKDIVIGVDSSTTACKAILWDLEGNRLAEGRAEIPMLRPKPDWHEQDARDWWTAMVNALRIAVHGVVLDRIAGLCICPQRETFVPVDIHCRPIRNAILWMDVRASNLMHDLVDNIGEDQFHQITGKPLSGNLTLLKILWLRRFELEIFARTAKFLDVAAFLNHGLTGVYATGWGIAGPTGLLDLHNSEWSVQILKFLGLQEEHMPDIYPTGGFIGRVTQGAANETGLPVGLPVYAGIGDGQAGGLGLGITKPGDCYLSLGTSIVSGSFTERFVTSNAFRTMLAPIAGCYYLETVILGGTYTIDWFLENFGQNTTISELETRTQELLPGAEGLLLLPYWNSVLNPYWDPLASGLVIGLRGHHGQHHVYRAILEGIAFEVFGHFEGVETGLGGSIERLVLTGGGSKSDLWCQIFANVTAKTIYRSEASEATALGAGMIAAVGVGAFPNYPSASRKMSPSLTDSFSPQPNQARIYTRIYQEVYKDLFPAIQEVMGRLAISATIKQ